MQLPGYIFIHQNSLFHQSVSLADDWYIFLFIYLSISMFIYLSINIYTFLSVYFSSIDVYIYTKLYIQYVSYLEKIQKRLQPKNPWWWGEFFLWFWIDFDNSTSFFASLHRFKPHNDGSQLPGCRLSSRWYIFIYMCVCINIYTIYIHIFMYIIIPFIFSYS